MTRGARHPASGKRSRARLAAVQALYQIDLTGAAPGAVIEEFRLHRLAGQAAADAALFADLVEGACATQADIDALLRSALAEGWTLERLESVLRAALRAGVYELMAHADVPARVAINEYVDIAHAFAVGRDVGFLNGVLDRLARRLRPGELELTPAR
ncbi:MAG: transcription antitermination factor NusB [Pseudomonadota bacterium]